MLVDILAAVLSWEKTFKQFKGIAIAVGAAALLGAFFSMINLFVAMRRPRE